MKTNDITNMSPEDDLSTPQKLFFALIDLMKDRPLERITIKEITYRAGFSRRTFYFYFSSVKDILYAFIDYIVGRIIRDIDDIFPKDSSLAVCGLKIWHEQMPALRIILKDPGVNPEKFFNYLKDSLRRKTGIHISTPGALFNPFSEFYFGGVCRLLKNWTISDEPVPLEEMTAIFRRIDEIFEPVMEKNSLETNAQE